MKVIFTILFATLVEMLSAQTVTQADTLRIEADKIMLRSVYGKYIHQTYHGYTELKIRRTKHFKERGFTNFGWTIHYGKWEIQNDTLMLIIKSYREKPFAKRTKHSQETQYIMNNGTLFRLNRKTVSNYIPKRQWKKSIEEQNEEETDSKID